MIVLALVATGLGLSGPASAKEPQTVESVPAGWTPYLPRTTADQLIEELRPCEGTMYAVGRVTTVGRGPARYARSNAFSFSATTGLMTKWAPRVNGAVRSIALSPDCSTAYLGGTFTRVNGRATSNMVAIDTATGDVRKRFAVRVNGPVQTVRYTHGVVIIGGAFSAVNGVGRTLMASLDPRTGRVTRYLDLRFAGSYPGTQSKVYNSQLSHGRDKLLIQGVFTSIDGRARQQAAVLSLGRTRARLNAWRSPELRQACRLRWYVRAGTWSPDDRTIYLATTGVRPVSGPGSRRSQPRAGLCDAVAAFRAAPAAVRHTWINYSGCDSYYSVAADHDNVYVSGHGRWADNRNGCDRAGRGAVSRPGIGSINPRSGRVTSWNPTRSRGYGSHQLLVTQAGLWVASDTWTNGSAQRCGDVGRHGGICFLPY